MDKIDRLNGALVFAYVDLYVRYRALVAVLAPRLGLHPERLEQEIRTWLEREQSLEAVKEAESRLVAPLAGSVPPKWPQEGS